MNRLRMTVALVLLFWLTAHADIVHLKDGRTLEGEVISETDESVLLKTRHGNVEIFKSHIERIEKKPLPSQLYRQKAAALEDNDAEGHYRLALWCKQQKLEKEYIFELERVITINSDHAAARRALGYERTGDSWIKKEPSQAPLTPEVAQAIGIMKMVLLAEGKEIDGLIEELRVFDGIGKKEFEQYCAAVAKWRSFSPAAAGIRTVHFPKSNLPCSIQVPEGYDGKTPIPALLILHGSTEGSGDMIRAWNTTSAAEEIKNECILIAPESKDSRWWRAQIREELDILLEEIKNTYNIDTTRLYLTGFSNGAHGTWYYGLRRPDIFAAIATDSGLPLSTEGDRVDYDSLKNAVNLPIYAINGKDDNIAPAPRMALVLSKLRQYRCSEVLHKELPGGHRAHTAEAWGDVYQWLGEHSRKACPRAVRIHCDGTGPKRAFWLELVEPSEKAQASARIRKGIVEVTATGASGVTIYLSDDLVDLNREVTVRLNNRRVFLGSVKRSPAVALETCIRRNDRNFTYAAKLKFELK